MAELKTGSIPATMGDAERCRFEAWPTAVAEKDGTDAFYFRQLKGQRLGAHVHPKSDHFLTILEGVAYAWVDGEGLIIVEAGDLMNIPAGVVHDLYVLPDADVWGVDLQTPRAGIEPTAFDPDRDAEIDEALNNALHRQS